MGRTTTFLVGLGLLMFAACNGSADPPPPTPTPTATSTSATPTPPTPPAMPEAAKAHTKAGAKAFVEYFWDVVNYAQATGDTDAIRGLTDAGCEQCLAGINSINKIYSNGGVIQGGEATTRNYQIRLFKVGGTNFATVEYDIAVRTATFDYAGTGKDSTTPPTDGHRRARLAADQGTAWRVVQLEGLA